MASGNFARGLQPFIPAIAKIISSRLLDDREKGERQGQIDELFDSIKVGDLVHGVVTTITDYGAFINIGAVDGLVHRDNISYGRIQ